MNRRSIVAVLGAATLVLGVAAASAQQEKKQTTKTGAPTMKMEMPKPGPEVQKLGYFVGSWRSDAEVKENPMGMPSGKMTETAKCEWFEGKFAVVCHSNGSGPMGPMHALGIIGYNTEDKKYTYYGTDSSGHSQMATGTMEGNTWTFTADEKMGGKMVHGRYTMSDTTPTSYKFKWEMSEDNQKWTTVMEGQSHKGAGKEPTSEKK